MMHAAANSADTSRSSMAPNRPATGAQIPVLRRPIGNQAALRAVTFSQGGQGVIQRKKCACGGEVGPTGECAECRRKREAGLQRKATSRNQGVSAMTLVDEVVRSPGRPLAENDRTYMEQRLGFDLGSVRIHDDVKASASAQAVSALAYTTGTDIVFRSGQYAPGSSAGRHLLAHELAHVVQQSHGATVAPRAGDGLRISEPHDALEREADAVAAKVVSSAGDAAPVAGWLPARGAYRPGLQRQVNEAESAGTSAAPLLPPVSWARGPTFGAPLQLPMDEAARRVTEGLSVIGEGLSYVRWPPVNAPAIASIGSERPEELVPDLNVQTFPDRLLQRAHEVSGALANVHGGVVGSLQVCYDCLSGAASLKGWIWAGLGYESPFGWLGGYYFGEKEWWSGNLGSWFEPGQCDPACDTQHHGDTKSGFGIAGFPLDIRPKERQSFSKAGLEGGVLLTPHSLCDADLELIALLNVLGYLGPVAGIATKSVAAINRVTRDTPHVELEAGIDVSVSFHLCRGVNHFLTLNHADFCAGGYVGAGIGLSHSKTGNHGVV